MVMTLYKVTNPARSFENRIQQLALCPQGSRQTVLLWRCKRTTSTYSPEFEEKECSFSTNWACLPSALFDDAVNCYELYGAGDRCMTRRWSTGGMIPTRQAEVLLIKTCPSATFSTTNPTYTGQCYATRNLNKLLATCLL
jgi:hypothetical protein